MAYLPGRKAAALLGIHQNTLRRYSDQGIIPSFKTASGQRRYDVEAFLRNGSERHTICYCRVSSHKQKIDLLRQVQFMQEQFPMPTSSPTSAEASTGNAKDSSPYWNDFTKEISSVLWLPTATDSRGSDSNSSNGLHTKTEEASWFSITRTQAPSPNLPRIFSPSSILSLADSTDSAATEKQSRKTRLYPDRKQRHTIKLWFDAARWCYNKSI